MSNGHRMDRVPYSPELLKLVLDDMVLDAGVTPLLHTVVLAASAPERRIGTVLVHGKGGALMLRPSVLVDASGDIDVLYKAGARFLDLDPGEQLQPATMMFRFGPLDHVRFEAIAPGEKQRLAKRGFELGHRPRAALHASREPGSDDAWFNIGRLAVDATDPLALGAAEIEGRRQAWRAARFLADEVPGCETGRLRGFGTQIGVRETRRVRGGSPSSSRFRPEGRPIVRRGCSPR